ncbi:hypothetical protein [Pseudoalteromonas byunsanensis]|uniref:Uncharacterized protein n=1 Tax=Pseudoalteromonas byunsanensis TaxID=327939 RepID=A0A1S1N2R3_9GAMM|nr:hypothetical protein [Pseudoalteromonas byunsanensis]OHU93656.1 hypothetical protein BIW53_20185 [Pseudoalteromonas byunsanensis]
MALFRTYNVDSEQQLTLPVTIAITLVLLALTLFTFPSQAINTSATVQQECSESQCTEQKV